MPTKIYSVNHFSKRMVNFDRRRGTNNDDIDIEEIISSVITDKATEIMNNSSIINIEIENPKINQTNIECYLEYTYNSNNILNVYKNNILVNDYTFNNNSRYITIPLTWNSSTYSIVESETLDNIIIYIETISYDSKINYSYN
jgi:hypothetical protein